MNPDIGSDLVYSHPNICKSVVDISSKPRQPWVLIFAFSIAAFSLTLASRGFTTAYSFWIDELFSEKIATSNWPDVYAWLIKDIHPPLYLIGLKLWASLMGNSELSIRLPSLIAAGFTLFIFAKEAVQRNQVRRLLALALIGVSPTFVYFAQEGRSNSIALLLSSLVTVTALKLREARFLGDSTNQIRHSIVYYLTAWLLAMTHYFGSLYIMILCVINLFEGLVEPKRWKSILLMISILLWPIYSIVFGNLSRPMASGLSYVTVKPVMGTIKEYLLGCMPIAYPALFIQGSVIRFLLVWSLLIAIILLSFGSSQRLGNFIKTPNSTNSPVSSESRFLIIVLVLFLSIMILIDIRRSISVSRHYIVLLPATMLLVANALSAMAGRSHQENLYRIAAVILSFALVASLSITAQADLSGKIKPMSNWKDMAIFVRKTGICSQGCLVTGSAGLHTYYFEKEQIPNFQEISSKIPEKEQVKIINSHPQLPVIGFHFAAEQKLSHILGDDKTCLQPIQNWSNSVFISIPKSLPISDIPAPKMIPCT